MGEGGEGGRAGEENLSAFSPFFPSPIVFMFGLDDCVCYFMNQKRKHAKKKRLLRRLTS